MLIFEQPDNRYYKEEDIDYVKNIIATRAT